MHLYFAILAASLCNRAAAAATAVTVTAFETQYKYHIVNFMEDQYGNTYSTQTLESFGTSIVPAPTSEAALGEVRDENYSSLSHGHGADAFAYTSPSSTWSPKPVTSTTSRAPHTPQTYETSTSAKPVTSVTSHDPYSPQPVTSHDPYSPQPVTSRAPYTHQTHETSTSTKPTKTTSSAPVITDSDGGFFSGDATYYDVGLGACGVTNTDSEFIAALNVEQFDAFGSMSNGNPVCGLTATVHFQGKSVSVTIQDKCPGCAYGDLDLSPAAFAQLADESLGRIPIKWNFS